MSALSVAVIIACIVLVAVVVRLVAKGRLMLRYSLLWLLLAVLALLCAIFPGPLFALSSAAGFEKASNFVFFLGSFFLLGISLSFAVIVSKQSDNIRRLVQEVALLRDQVQGTESKNTDAERDDGSL